MAIYIAKSNEKRSFVLRKDDETEIGIFQYKKWFSFDAKITLANGEVFEISPKGFWDSSIEFKQGEKVFLNFKMGWKGIIFKTIWNNFESDYLLKSKGLLSNTSILVDHDGNEIAAIKTNFTWKDFKYSYTIESSDYLEQLDHKAILLFGIVHAINYQMTMIATT